MNRSDYTSIDNELAVLGSILFENESIIKILDKVEPRDFYDTRNQRIYKACVELFAKEKDECIKHYLVFRKLWFYRPLF